ncbi:urease accessory protein UreD [Corticibacter populi]|nr:urease accessory protein UreD [Corticibacter populi]
MTAPPVPAPQSWRAELQLQFEAQAGRTVLASKRHHGPMLVQRPFHPEGAPCHTYLLHPPGGVVGGDSLALDVQLAPGAHALLTMPGATKFYRSADATSLLHQHFALAAGSTLEWLPQDNIFFPGAKARLDTRFDMADGARLLAWEGLCLGRPVMGEAFSSGQLGTRLQVWRNGRPLLHERLRIKDGALAKLGGHPLLATLVAAPASAMHLELARDVLASGLPGHAPAGATLLDEVLVVRLLHHDNIALQAVLQQLWMALRPALLGLAPCPPRIWAT